MASFTEPAIMDTNILALISEARKEDGVHIYLDQPHMDSNVSQNFGTTIADLSKTTSATFTLTSLLVATGHNPHVVIGFKNAKDTLTMEIGMQADMVPYTSRYQKTWHNTSFTDAITWNTGVFKVFSMHFSYPRNNNTSADLTCEIDGVSTGGKTSFDMEDELKNLAELFFNHVHHFTRVSVLEHHILYTGITAALPRNPDKPLISNESGKHGHLPSMSPGGWAVIVGSYIDVNANYDGITVGFFHDHPKTFVFTTLQTEGEEVVIRLSVTVLGVRVVTDGESSYINVKSLDDQFVPIILENIDIKNIEIHTGIKVW